MTGPPERYLSVRPAPAVAPPIIDADEAYGPTTAPYLQDALAIDLFPRHVSFDRQPTRRGDLPDPRPVVAHLAQALVEVMAGVRPAPQVLRWTSPSVYSVVARRAALAVRRGSGGRRSPVVRSIRVEEPADAVVEACAVVVHHDRVRAVALRLVGLDNRWVVTALEMG